MAVQERAVTYHPFSRRTAISSGESFLNWTFGVVGEGAGGVEEGFAGLEAKMYGPFPLKWDDGLRVYLPATWRGRWPVTGLSVVGPEPRGVSPATGPK